MLSLGYIWWKDPNSSIPKNVNNLTLFKKKKLRGKNIGRGRSSDKCLKPGSTTHLLHDPEQVTQFI